MALAGRLGLLMLSAVPGELVAPFGLFECLHRRAAGLVAVGAGRVVGAGQRLRGLVEFVGDAHLVAADHVAYLLWSPQQVPPPVPERSNSGCPYRAPVLSLRHPCKSLRHWEGIHRAGEGGLARRPPAKPSGSPDRRGPGQGLVGSGTQAATWPGRSVGSGQAGCDAAAVRVQARQSSADQLVLSAVGSPAVDR